MIFSVQGSLHVQPENPFGFAENIEIGGHILINTYTSLDQKLDLYRVAKNCQEAYSSAHPFPHIVIDNFFPEDILNKILLEFPGSKEVDWQRFDSTAEKKLASTHESQMGDSTRYLLYYLNSSTFVSFLEELTGIQGIIPDPHFSGGGLHQIERGGYLKVHIDFNTNNQLKIDRRLNLLLYLNKDWKDEYGGHLELWDSEMKECAKKILPVFNRLVIFSTTDFSYHGHPEPLTCPENLTRKSLALYYYSNGRPAEELNGENHSTVFKARPGENIDLGQHDENSKSSFVKKFIPPILMEILNR